MAASLRPKGWVCVDSDPVCEKLEALNPPFRVWGKGPSIDVETMKLKRGLDLGRQIRDIAEQLRARDAEQ
jgi:hypothetical protein